MYRSVDTEVWGDPWFQEHLNRDQKLLFLCLITNQRTTTVGAYQITPASLSVETGIPMAEIEPLLLSLAPKVMWWPKHRIVWIRNFFRRQFKSPNDKIITNATGVLAGLPSDVRDAVCMEYPALGTPCDTPPIPHAYPTDESSLVIEEKRRELDTASVEEQDDALAREPSPAVIVDTPFAVYSAFMDELASPDHQPAPKWKDRQLGIAKRLIEQGYGTDKVRRCVVFMRSQSWRTGPFDLGTVEKYIGTWEVNGEPEREQPRHRLREVGGTPGSGGAGGDGRDPDIERRGYDYDEAAGIRAVGR